MLVLVCKWSKVGMRFLSGENYLRIPDLNFNTIFRSFWILLVRETHETEQVKCMRLLRASKLNWWICCEGSHGPIDVLYRD